VDSGAQNHRRLFWVSHVLIEKASEKNSINIGIPKNRGGAKLGPNGRERRAVSAEQADRVAPVMVAGRCPHCNGSDW